MSVAISGSLCDPASRCAHACYSLAVIKTLPATGRAAMGDQVKKITEIGVVVDDIPSNLKQYLLLFDAVSFVDVDAKIDMLRAQNEIAKDGKFGALANDIEFLASENLVYNTSTGEEQAKRFIESLPFEDLQKQIGTVRSIEKEFRKKKTSAVRRFNRLKNGIGKQTDLERLTKALNEAMAYGELLPV
jgi:hypothetical protein